jgi:3-oxoacyl-[acyl-carrier protein] reductase
VSAGGPLAGRTALVTGVSRRAGIGFAIARRLAQAGADVVLHAHGPEPGIAADVAPGARLIVADFTDPRAPDAVMAEAAPVDVLVVNHALDAPQALGEMTAEVIDRSLAVNVRAPLLLVQAFAAQHDGRPGGRVILMTSGQYHDVQPRELPYVAGKGALHQLTLTLAGVLAPRAITVNTVDPGPTDTGWATPEIHAAVKARMPFGRWGEPDDAARLIAFLASDDGRWITGQVIGSTGGDKLLPSP